MDHNIVLKRSADDFPYIECSCGERLNHGVDFFMHIYGHEDTQFTLDNVYADRLVYDKDGLASEEALMYAIYGD